MNVCETSSLIFLDLCNSKSAQHLPTSYLQWSDVEIAWEPNCLT